MIALVIDAAPAEYQSLLTGEQHQLWLALKIEDLEGIMNQYWRQVQPSDRSGGKDSDDVELVVLNAFDGYCFTCKKERKQS